MGKGFNNSLKFPGIQLGNSGHLQVDNKVFGSYYCTTVLLYSALSSTLCWKCTFINNNLLLVIVVVKIYRDKGLHFKVS